MIESIDNAFQLILTGICTVISIWKAYHFRKKAWILLGLSSGVFFLGCLYWQLYLVFYGKTPQYSYISSLSWYSAYIFLILLVLEIRGGEIAFKSLPHHRLLYIIPVFAIGMCIFFSQKGD
ncbi:MAG: hypothetical protein IKS48_09840 [Eubacterium sp.]|nr:hypothetical protein [Eubacterium sp.]